MNWKIGDSFRARDTRHVRDSGIVPGAGGRIEGINGARISFYLEQSHPEQTVCEGQATLSRFNENFVADKAKESARRSKTTANTYSTVFPRG